MQFNFSLSNKKIYLSDAIKQCIEKKYILVFEECDCLLKVVKSRKIRDEASDIKAPNILDTLCAKMSTAKDATELKMYEDMIQKHEPSSMIDLETLLTEIDGLKSRDGLLIIATTNHPELIDSVLKREFRLEPFELHNFDNELTTQLIRHLYYLDNDVAINLSENLIIKPSTLSRMCLHYTNYKDLIIYLNNNDYSILSD